MPFQKGQSGNPGGRAKERAWAETIRIAVNEAYENGDKKKLRALADKLVQKALDGDMAAMKEIGDRLDGKPAQSTHITGEVESPMVARMPAMCETSEDWQAQYAPKVH